MYNAAIVGCGNIASGFDDVLMHEFPKTHAGAYWKSKKIYLIAACDPNFEKINNFKNKWGTKYTTPAIEDFIKIHEKIDVVSICSPTKIHFEHLKVALKLKPKVVFCEKPLTDNIEKSKEIVRKYTDANTTLVVNYSRRWDPDVIILKDRIQNKDLGKIYSITGIYNKGIFNNGSHMIDLIQYIFGELDIISTGPKIFDYSRTDPTISALLVTSKNIPVMLNIADSRAYTIFELQIITENGVIRMEESGLVWIERRLQRSVEYPAYKVLDNGKRWKGRYLETMHRTINNIESNLDFGTVFPSTGLTAFSTQITCHKLYELAMKRDPLLKDKK